MKIPFLNFLLPIRLYLGGSSKSSSTQNVDSSTKVETTNKQVGASEGSFAVGSDSTVNYTSADPEIAKASFDAITEATKSSSDVSKKAIETTAVVSRDATRDALDFGESALDNVRRTTESANALLSRTQENFVGTLARNAGDAPQTIAQDSMKNMLYIGLASVVAILGFGYLNRK